MFSNRFFNSILLPGIILILVHPILAQTAIENWQTYTDPEKRFTLFYPPDWTAKGNVNFLNSNDLTLQDAKSERLRVTISYRINDSMLNSSQIMPETALSKFEDEQRPAYQLYHSLGKSPTSYRVYGFPTASNIIDYTKHSGESGRTLNVLAIVNGKNTFSLSYSNTIENFYKSLPVVEEIVGPILVLK